ncbi:hypothetical protein QTP88_008329 [Uroleucon formosanum]
MHGATTKQFFSPPPMSAYWPHTNLAGAPWIPAAVRLAATTNDKPSKSSDRRAVARRPSAASSSSIRQPWLHYSVQRAGGPPVHVQLGDSRRPHAVVVIHHNRGHRSSHGGSMCGKSISTYDELLKHICKRTSAGDSAVSAASCTAVGAMSPMSPTVVAAFSAYNRHLSRHLFYHPFTAVAHGKKPSMIPSPPCSAFNLTAAHHHHHHHQQQQQQCSPRVDTSAATVSR